MYCIKCDSKIPVGRLKALPDTKTCVNCSTESKWYTRPIISGKTTYSELEVIKDPETAKEMHRYDTKGRTGYGSSLYRVKR